MTIHDADAVFLRRAGFVQGVRDARLGRDEPCWRLRSEFGALYELTYTEGRWLLELCAGHADDIESDGDGAELIEVYALSARDALSAGRRKLDAAARFHARTQSTLSQQLRTRCELLRDEAQVILEEAR